MFETPQGEAEMEDFVRRNTTNCEIKPGEEICHKQYHYTDINIQQPQYKPGLVGARNDDIVAAIVAAIHKLKGEPVPAPFDFKDKREALLLLIHYAGDIHQPLHVGAIYLNANGKRVDPDKKGFDPATDTRGGNNLSVSSGNLHSLWDAIPNTMTVSHIDSVWIKKAKTVPASEGDLYGWPGNWATDTLGNAGQAFRGLKFGKLANRHWPTTLPRDYSVRMSTIKKDQLTEGGAHLAELLETIWP